MHWSPLSLLPSPLRSRTVVQIMFRGERRGYLAISGGTRLPALVTQCNVAQLIVPLVG
jgi:hypothetical protein